ncbi:hypothetical protein AMTR_s01729p00004150 [Amborella trichopoda]|uniref:Uncharacterized protein n=1 Tax=Amborella trichopoda TaxID=13333 RepID=U5D7Q5_AMBTC|nr:hypothetical protein AMTR_s01729p00004150 [Amborella trichopoda]
MATTTVAKNKATLHEQPKYRSVWTVCTGRRASPQAQREARGDISCPRIISSPSPSHEATTYTKPLEIREYDTITIIHHRGPWATEATYIHFGGSFLLCIYLLFGVRSFH